MWSRFLQYLDDHPGMQTTLEALGLLLAVLVIVVPAAVFVWKRQFPYRFRFSLDPFRFEGGKNRERQHVSSWNHTPRSFQLLARIQPRHGVRFERIGVRFVERRWVWDRWTRGDWRTWAPWPIWKWRNSEIVEVACLTDLEVSTQVPASVGQQFHQWVDQVGGRWAQYVPPYLRTVEGSLWLCVEVKAAGDWKGHLSFQGHLIESHRAYARRRVSVQKTKDMRMETFKC